MSILHKQVIIGRGNVNTAGAQWFFVFYIYNAKTGYILKQIGQQIVRVTTSMLYNEQRYVEVTGQI